MRVTIQLPSSICRHSGAPDPRLAHDAHLRGETIALSVVPPCVCVCVCVCVAFPNSRAAATDLNSCVDHHRSQTTLGIPSPCANVVNRIGAPLSGVHTKDFNGATVNSIEFVVPDRHCIPSVYRLAIDRKLARAHVEDNLHASDHIQRRPGRA